MGFDINYIKKRMLIKYPLFGSIMANCVFEATDKVPTAATDGKKIYYNPKFMENLDEKEQVFVLAHETCHIAFDHLKRSKDKNPLIWNKATDAVINALLMNDGLKMVEGGIDIPEAINYNAEEMYEKLYEEERNNPKGKGSSKDNNEQNNGAGHATHDMWGNGAELSENNNSGESQDSSSNNKVNEKEIFQENKEERQRKFQEMKEKLANESFGHGDGLEGNVRNVYSVGRASRLVDWRKLLKEAVVVDVDWSYANSTIEEGVVTPHLEDIVFPKTEIVLDTSGSINERLLRNFLKEVKNIVRTSSVSVGCFDTKFYGFTKIKDDKSIDNLKFHGGGGTNFDVAVRAFSKRCENKIIFTDGEAPMPMDKMDVIWIVFGYRKIYPKGGKVIYIDKQELYKSNKR